ncbi:ferritin-like domain-containing protein [Streptomyces blattellae]|uniref:ferritin-like domain-containing protein n=1 Tax=Streptomyces blattellae TaxID=2569855 RepID=UPI0012B8875C|nr:DUF2202 domain-containing protein [Streptomyces blattellae]
MKRNVKLATALTAGALAIGGVLAAGPVVADSGDPSPRPDRTTAERPTTGGAPHHGHRQGDHGTDGRHDGSCTSYRLAPQGTLTASQKAALADQAEEEQLAHDLYTVFADRYDARVFDRIAAAETHHLTAVRTLLDRYAVTDPTADRPAGDFVDPTVQATYDRLLKQGEDGLDAALEAGRTVESKDIDALTEALSGLTAPDVRQVYDNLLAASERHLAAFDRWIATG